MTVEFPVDRRFLEAVTLVRLVSAPLIALLEEGVDRVAASSRGMRRTSVARPGKPVETGPRLGFALIPQQLAIAAIREVFGLNDCRKLA